LATPGNTDSPVPARAAGGNIQRNENLFFCKIDAFQGTVKEVLKFFWFFCHNDLLMKAHINLESPTTGKEVPLTKIAHFSKYRERGHSYPQHSRRNFIVSNLAQTGRTNERIELCGEGNHQGEHLCIANF
jgi:hypothetical protein